MTGRLNSIPGSARIVRIVNNGSGGSVTAGNLSMSSGKLRLRNGSTTVGTSGVTLAAGTTYRVGIHQQRGTTSSNGVLEAYVATGDAAFSAPFASSSSQNVTSPAKRVEIGATNSVTLNAVFDDIAVDTGTLPGPSASIAGPALARVDATAQPMVAQAQVPRSITQAWGNAAPAPLQQTGVQTRTITYGYDDLNRLTSAVEGGATSNSYSYTYDKVGNRLDGGRTYDAANQVIGWTYDAAGNLLGDGTTTYSYDALNRAVTTGGTANSYNADGTLVQQGSTRYIHDLASPLSQILGDGTSTYVYGQERLYAQASGGAKLWYASDALGSVRQTLDNSGTVMGSVAYDPWGQVQQGSVPTFGFTGELQQGSNVYLRARWYNSQRGTFTSRDSFAGMPEQPPSLHAYMYAKNTPVNLLDPTGFYYCDSPAGTFPYPNTDYVAYCQAQRARLLIDPIYMGYRSHDMLSSLIYLFTDPRLPGGAQQAVDLPYKGSSMTGLFNVTPAQERLDFVLWITQSPSTGKLTDKIAAVAGLGTHFNDTFVRATDANGDLDLNARSDTGFAKQFRDGDLWLDSSRQVGHFLTAAHFGSADSGAHCAVGHELRADGSGELGQCLAGELPMLSFFNAVEYDLAGDYAQRECIIKSIMYDLPEDFDPAQYQDRIGNSRQDLRLTVKGWGFGKLVRQGDIATLAQAQKWLTKNLR